MKKYFLFACATVAAGLAAMGQATAHHSFAMFDKSKTIYLEGTVESWAFNNPHTWLYITIMKPGGGTEKWGFEGSAPVSQIGKGINGFTFKAGDFVKLVMCPLKDGRNGGHMAFVVLKDGKIVTPNDGGCPGPAIRDEWQSKKWLETAKNGEEHPVTRQGVPAPAATPAAPAKSE